MLCKLHIGLRLDVDARARGDIIEDRGDIDAVRNCSIVRNETVLRTFVVIRRDKEKRICPDLLRILREFNRIGGLIRACARNHGNTPLYLLHSKANRPAVLRIRHRRRLSRCARDNDGIGPARNLVLNDVSKFRIIDSCFGKRRNDSNACATENKLFHGKLPLQIHLFLLSHARHEKSKFLSDACQVRSAGRTSPKSAAFARIFSSPPSTQRTSARMAASTSGASARTSS